MCSAGEVREICHIRCGKCVTPPVEPGLSNGSTVIYAVRLHLYDISAGQTVHMCAVLMHSAT